MKGKLTKGVAILLLVTTSVMMSGCYGSFALTSKLHRWNGQVSNKKFVNELVFFGLCILPAYELACLGDALIFNSIEFWGGNNPIAMNEGETEEMDVVRKGQTYHLTKTLNNLEISQADGDSVHFRYFPEEKSWYLMEGESKVKVVEMKKKTVFTYLPNNKTLAFDQNNAAEIETEIMAAQ